MKKLILAICMVFATAAFADGRGHGHHSYYHHGNGLRYSNNNNWIAPLIIGGVVTYALTRPQPQLSPPPVVYSYPQQLPPPPYGYHYENIVDVSCNCYRVVIVQN